MGIEAYREHRITGYQRQKLLGIESRYELDGLLKQHQVWLENSVEDLSASGNWASGSGKSAKRSLPRKRNVNAALDDRRF